MKKYLVVVLLLCVYGCKENTTEPKAPNVTSSIEYRDGESIKNIAVYPYYPDSIKFSFYAADTLDEIIFVILKDSASIDALAYFTVPQKHYSYTLQVSQSEVDKYFIDSDYFIKRAYHNRIFNTVAKIRITKQ